MEEIFSITSSTDKISVSIVSVQGFPNETFFMGGYDAECTIEILCNGFSAKGHSYFSTAMFYDFLTELEQSYKTLSGLAKFSSYENDFYLAAESDGIGHVLISGLFSKEPGNELKFYFETDQTFIQKTLSELSKIASKYGGKLGVK